MFSPVNIPKGGIFEVYTTLKQRREFGYANVRKATYRGIEYISLQVRDNLGNMDGSVR